MVQFACEAGNEQWWADTRLSEMVCKSERTNSHIADYIRMPMVIMTAERCLHHAQPCRQCTNDQDRTSLMASTVMTWVCHGDKILSVQR